ncbi:MAG: LPS export ABC transporter permease LptF [Proteobacteria bacterium]|nr:LPS export ABC transporter permease LptF [Pseudomonadota bacterium]MBU4011102.1 LPS export ABC transporter permease LptF [Pseudomonadota bacterium]MBU4036345.1 LPS export ABC transporter permease LptF [Pseudomonadota bacterium]
MKINTIVSRYLFKEMLSPFAINTLFFTFLFLMAKILFVTNLVVNYNMSLSKIGLMFLYIIPNFLVFVIPMSVMMAILLTFLRFSSDNEIIALKTGGISIYGLLPPVLIFCFIGCILTFLISVYAMPWGRLSIEKLTMEIAQTNFEIGLKERTFNDNFKNIMLYVNKINLKDDELLDVFVEDHRSEDMASTIIAPRGILFFEKDKLSFRLRLFDGVINQVSSKKKSVNSIGFDTYDINLDLKNAFSEIEKKGQRIDEKKLFFNELIDYIDNFKIKNSKYYNALFELHKKFSVPFACFVLGILSVALGTQLKSATRSFGLGLGLIFFLLYYLILSIGYALGESRFYPPFVGMWVPNILIGGIGIYLFIRTANERPVNFFAVIDLFERIKLHFIKEK